MKSLQFRAMNTDVLLVAEGQGWAETGLQITQAFIHDCESRFSRFKPESELSQLNRSNGNWFITSEDLLDMLLLSREFYNETDGLFDPSILPDLKRAGYDKSMDEIRQGVDSTRPVSLQTSLTSSGRRPRPAFSEMEIDQPGKRVRLPRGLEIDLGGIAKGWIVNRAASMLASYSGICAVSAGGDIRFVGYPMGLLNWRVEVEDPREPTRTVAVLYVGEGAVATSSIAKRTWNQNGNPRHHLIDPRSGEPAQTEWLSVTVIAPDIEVAEVYAKTLLIGGQAEAHRLQNYRPDVAYLTVDADGISGGSVNIKEYMHEYNHIPG